jgi:hypothetical protein
MQRHRGLSESSVLAGLRALQKAESVLEKDYVTLSTAPKDRIVAFCASLANLEAQAACFEQLLDGSRLGCFAGV